MNINKIVLEKEAHQSVIDDMVDAGVCPKCGGSLATEAQNNGFSAPDPTFWEVTRIWCPECGWEY